jgi:hypothetical protein
VFFDVRAASLHDVVLGQLGVHCVHHVGGGVADAVPVGAQHGVRRGGVGVVNTVAVG